jgi:GNAT superfamily N-acetyltransferase
MTSIPSPFTVYDLPSLSALQPPGWSDILPAFEFYTRAAFCRPLKIVEDKNVIAVGSAIIHGSTAWLGHIIVSDKHRGRGLGTAITSALVEIVKETSCETIMLLATKLGEPVYQKVGFIAESSYTFLKGEPIVQATDGDIIGYHEKYLKSILALDLQTTGEDRSKVIIPNLGGCLLSVTQGKLNGFYLPGLADGPIIAEERRVGCMLMTVRSIRATNFVVPTENEDAISFLITNNYQIYTTGTRMRLGKPFRWNPKNVYNRIAGNLG